MSFCIKSHVRRHNAELGSICLTFAPSKLCNMHAAALLPREKLGTCDRPQYSAMPVCHASHDVQDELERQIEEFQLQQEELLQPAIRALLQERDNLQARIMVCMCVVFFVYVYPAVQVCTTSWSYCVTCLPCKAFGGACSSCNWPD